MARTKKEKETPVITAIKMDEIVISLGLIRATIDEEGIGMLATSIKDVGLINPISVRKEPEGFVLIAGYRRYLAHVKLRAKTIRASVYAGTKTQSDAIMIHENLEREDINLVDEAYWINELIERQKLSNREVARRLRKSEGYIRDRLLINDYPDVIRAALKHRGINLAIAREFAKCTDEEQVAVWIEYGMETGVSAKIAENWVMQWKLTQESVKSKEDVTPMTDDLFKYKVPQQICEGCEMTGDQELFRFARLCVECRKLLKAVNEEIKQKKID